MTERPETNDAVADPDTGAGAEPGADESATQVEDVDGTRPHDERVADLLTRSIDVPVLAEAVERQDAADAADTLEHLEDEAGDVLVAMDDEAAALALAEMEAPLAASVLEDLLDEDQQSYAARLLHIMAPDDAADLLQSLDDREREVIYRVMRPSVAAQLRRLVGYQEDTAAGLMTTDFVALDDTMSVARATDAIRSSTIPESTHHIPVVHADGRLVGIVSLRSLLLGRPDAPITELLEPSVRFMRADRDQEDVAREFDRYDRVMLPVVDEQERLMGVITVDDVIDIIREEQTEDVQKTVGAGAEEAVYSGVLEKFRGRFRWLCVSLLVMTPSALVVSRFEWLIGELAILAVLMPIVAALAGNAGHQALAVTLRGIVLDQVRPDRVWPLIRREATVGLLTGLATGLIVGAAVAALASAVDGASWRLGLVVAISMTMSMCAGTLAGSCIPLVMRRVGADPAQSSAIVLIMITDAVAFAAFLGLAHYSYRWLVG